jgi:nitroreductase
VTGTRTTICVIVGALLGFLVALWFQYDTPPCSKQANAPPCQDTALSVGWLMAGPLIGAAVGLGLALCWVGFERRFGGSR